MKIDASQANPEGAAGLGPGAYHVAVEECGMDTKTGKFKVVFKCLAGRDATGNSETCVDMTKWEFYSLDPSFSRQLMNLAYCLGHISYDEWKAMYDAGAQVDLPLENSKGMQCCIEIAMKEGKVGTKNAGKMFANIVAMYPVNDPKAEHIPKNATMANIAAAALGTAPATAAPAAAPVSYGGF
jgi:hypothetical protein